MSGIAREAPLLCVWGGEPPPSLAESGKLEVLQAPAELGPLDALRWAFEQSGARGVVLAGARATIPSHWWDRLSGAERLDTTADAVTALDPSVPELNPARERTSDAAIYLLSDRSFFPQRAASPNLSWWLRRPERLDEAKNWAELVSGRARILTCDHCLVDVAEIAGTGGTALDPLRRRIQSLPAGTAAGISGYPGVDGLPVCLHILHSWGGGVARWVADYAAATGDRHHLALIAVGDEMGEDCGRQLVLCAGGATEDRAIVRWPLTQSLRATEVHHPEYEAVLTQLIRDFSVGQLIISSLIGHSLDALDTGLPTLVVMHDYYPAWPRLDINFEADEGPFTTDRLAEEPPTQRLKDLTPEHWENVADAYRQALHKPRVKLVAPDESIAANLKRLDPAYGELNVRVIPHGHRSLDATYRYQPRDMIDRLRIVVPGRISPNKGKQLLLDALPRLRDHADLYLLGSGSDGEDFFGLSGVHVLLDYDRNDLPELLQAIQPDLALLPSLTSETFSYTLSEFWSLGVPVLAARVGALANRIEPDETGWLFEPQPDPMVAAIEALGPEELAHVAEKVRTITLPDLGDMGAAYDRLQAPLDPAPYSPKLFDPDRLRNIEAATELLRLSDEAQRQRAAIRDLRKELQTRGEWGFELDRRLARRTAWAKSLEADLEKARARVEAQDSELAERTEWALKLDAELNDLRREAQEKLDEAWEEIGRLRAVEEHYEQIIASRSWKLTKPLRFAARLTRRALGIATGRGGKVVHLGRRTRQSLRVRGVRGTARRIGQEFRGKSAPVLKPPSARLTEQFDPLEFPTVEQPQVSVIIPVHNHFEHTYACLQSLLETSNEASFEVVIVDDASTDRTGELLPRISGIQTLVNEENLGFIGTCNRGAAHARGDHLVFLNNDTAVSDGWLDALLGTFESHPDAGLVGARLVYPDGRLQEAGGIVFSDGSGWNYGRFEDPSHPAYNFVREADYCSGAAIAIARELFETLGGFDTRYAPAYYEDTDLAFAVRKHGLRVYYQPAAVVTHFEGITSGTDTSSGIKRYQVVNQEKFQEKWAAELKRQPTSGTPIGRAREHGRPRRALIIDAYTPEPDQDSGSVRLTNLMQLFRELGYQVTFCPDNRAYVAGYTDALTQAGVEVYHHPWTDGGTRMFEEIGAELDVVLICRHYIAANYIRRVRAHCPRARLIFDTVDLHYLREQRLADLEGDEKLRETAEETRRAELAVARQSDLTLVVSPAEVEVLAQDAPDVRVGVLSNIHPVHGRRADFEARKDLMFVGGYQHPPNIDAVQWFVEKIFPAIRAELPGIRFHIIGSKAPPEVRRLGRAEGVEFHGFVKDIEPFFDGCRLAVAPLRYGAGVKGKVNSSMSYGQPVIATPTAVEGMGVTSGDEVLVAETAEAFAAAVLRAYNDPELWLRLSEGGLQNVEANFSFAAARGALERLLR